MDPQDITPCPPRTAEAGRHRGARRRRHPRPDPRCAGQGLAAGHPRLPPHQGPGRSSTTPAPRSKASSSSRRHHRHRRDSEAIYIIGPDAFMQRELTKVSFEDSGDALQNLMRVVSGKILSVFGKGAKTHPGIDRHHRHPRHRLLHRGGKPRGEGAHLLLPLLRRRRARTRRRAAEAARIQHAAPRHAVLHPQRHANGEDDGAGHGHQPYR
jgi:hypothetical protein